VEQIIKDTHRHQELAYEISTMVTYFMQQCMLGTTKL